MTAHTMVLVGLGGGGVVFNDYPYYGAGGVVFNDCPYYGAGGVVFNDCPYYGAGRVGWCLMTALTMVLVGLG